MHTLWDIVTILNKKRISYIKSCPLISCLFRLTNKFSIFGRFFQNKVGFQSNHLARATINQIVMKKANFFIFCKLERFALKSSKIENQQFPGNLPNIENLFGLRRNKFSIRYNLC
jgi:hypothetical protein